MTDAAVHVGTEIGLGTGRSPALSLTIDGALRIRTKALTKLDFHQVSRRGPSGSPGAGRNHATVGDSSAKMKRAAAHTVSVDRAFTELVYVSPYSASAERREQLLHRLIHWSGQ